LAQAPQLIGTHAAILLLPVEERGLGNSKLSAYLLNSGSGLSLLEGKGDLCLGKF